MRNFSLLLLLCGFPLVASAQGAHYDNSANDLTGGGTITGTVSMSGNDLVCVDDIYTTAVCEPTTDAAPRDSLVRTAQDAYSLATVNTTGGEMCVLGGEGANNVTVANYANCGTDTITVRINGVNTALVEATGWAAATSNAVTCASLCAAIDALVGVSCAACSGAVAPIVVDPGCYQVSVTSSDATCAVAASGTDGLVRMPDEILLGGSASTTSGIRIVNSSGSGMVYNGSKAGIAAWYTSQLVTSGTTDAAVCTSVAGGGSRLSSTGKYTWSDNANGALGTSDTTMQRDAAGIIGVTSAIRLTEMTAPAAGAANTARIFAQDNGAGKTQLCVLFASGAAQCFATEP